MLMNRSKALPGTIAAAHCTRATCKRQLDIAIASERYMASLAGLLLWVSSSHDHCGFLLEEKRIQLVFPLSDLADFDATLLFEGFEALTHFIQCARHVQYQHRRYRYEPQPIGTRLACTECRSTAGSPILVAVVLPGATVRSKGLSAVFRVHRLLYGAGTEDPLHYSSNVAGFQSRHWLAQNVEFFVSITLRRAVAGTAYRNRE